ncbi:MAG: STAS domain-containing protein [SAR324 cluster bacterium]|nr:STAS domain-containing protein [SAR324 cluster bacterium]
MKLSHHIEGKVNIITIEGELLGDAVLSFETSVFELVQKKEVQAVLVNLERIMFLDSFGIGVIVNVFKKLQQAQIGFGLFSLTREVLESFQITCLDQMIPIYETKEEALANYTQ